VIHVETVIWSPNILVVLKSDIAVMAKRYRESELFDGFNRAVLDLVFVGFAQYMINNNYNCNIIL